MECTRGFKGRVRGTVAFGCSATTDFRPNNRIGLVKRRSRQLEHPVVYLGGKSPSRTLAPTALWEMTLPDRGVPGNAPSRPPGLNFAEVAML